MIEQEQIVAYCEVLGALTVSRRDLWVGGCDDTILVESRYKYWCTLERGHGGPHIAQTTHPHKMTVGIWVGDAGFFRYPEPTHNTLLPLQYAPWATFGGDKAWTQVTGISLAQEAQQL